MVFSTVASAAGQRAGQAPRGRARQMRRGAARAVIVAGLAAAVLAAPLAAQAASEGTGLPLPRFVSLKAQRVNVRSGPSNDHAVKWIFVRSGLPVEVVQEFENWRRIRDSEGDEGWVYWSLLSGKRTALVAPWGGGEPVLLHQSPDDKSRITATLDPRVVVGIESCDGKWCRVTGKGFKGYAPQGDLWGVYPDETVK